MSLNSLTVAWPRVPIPGNIASVPARLHPSPKHIPHHASPFSNTCVTTFNWFSTEIPWPAMAVAGSGGYGSAVTLPCQTDPSCDGGDRAQIPDEHHVAKTPPQRFTIPTTASYPVPHHGLPALGEYIPQSLNAKSFSLQILRYPGPRTSHITPSPLSTFSATLTTTTSTNTTTNIIVNANLTPGFAS
ncbi:hypothetical protein Landi51_06452 [Colletotrichum acutatum]